MKILVLGAQGMLGHRVARELSDLDIIAPSRSEYNAPDSLARYGLTDDDYVINCIGAIPQKNKDINEMRRVNSEFPYLLRAEGNFRVIQIATDCAFYGDAGNYGEDSLRNAQDIYGRTKIYGELPSFMNLRCSIIGPELTAKKSLFEWVRNQPEGATLHGYVRHRWNGITTDAFAKIVRGVIENDLWFAGMQHLVPANQVTKHELVKLIAARTNRNDLNILPAITGIVDRTLRTTRPHLNDLLWSKAGYDYAPTIHDLVSAIAID